MKERLVGAAVLVAVAVIVIPIILNGHKQQDANGQQTPLPAADKTPTREYRMNLANKGAATVTQPATPADKPAPPQRLTPAPRARHSQAPSRALAQSPPETQTHRSREPAGSGANPSSGPGAPLAPQAANSAPPAAAPASGGWVVQAGSFSKQANAHAVVGQLKRKGYQAFISQHQADGTTYYRVRVGPVPDRAHAEALAPEVGNAYGGEVAVVPNK